MKKLLTILFLLPLFVSATTYYVRTDGSNSNSGTSNTSAGAWLTNVYAAAHTTSGDIIIVQPGTYSETALISLPVGVSWQGTDSATCIIKSNVSADYGPMVDVSSGSYTSGNQTISNLKFDGQLTNFLAIFVGKRGDVIIHDCSFKNFLDRGVIFSAKGDYTDGAPGTYATGNKFYNNRVLNCARYQHPNGNFGMGCLNIGGQSGIDIYNNTIIQNQRTAGDNGWPIKYANEGHNKLIKIHSNTLIKNKFLGNSNGDGDWDFCIELWYSEGGCEIYSNTIEGGIDLAYNNRNAYSWSYWFHHNTVSQPTLNDKFQGGIYTERQANGMIIEYNTFDKIAAPLLINIEDFGDGPYQNLENIVFRKNLCTNLGRAIGDGNNGAGIEISTHSTATFDLDSLLIDNNTFVAAPGNAPFEGIYINIGTASGTITNVYIRNNIVQGFWDYWLRVSNSATTITGFTERNNNLYNNASSNAHLFVDGNPTGYSSTGNVTTSPGFVGGSDYTLGLGSLNIDGGVNIGLTYCGIAPEIGYAEYGCALNGGDTFRIYGRPIKFKN